MIANRISIKTTIVASLITVGVVTIMLSIIASYTFRSAAISSQQQTLSRILEVSSNEGIRQLHDLAIDLGSDTKKGSKFRSLRKKTFSDPSSQNKKELSEFLNNQFHQRYVTAGYVDLKKMRVFDLNYNLVAQSSQGISGLTSSLPKQILTQVKNRKGADRLKAVGALWLYKNEPLYSALLPVGGLSIKGYMEVVISPVHNLFKISEMLQAPLSIENIDGESIKDTDNWKNQSESTLNISYTVKDLNNNPILKIEAKENVEFLFNTMASTQFSTVAGFAILMLMAIFILLFLMKKYLFKPLSCLIDNMQHCGDGDLTVAIREDGFKDVVDMSHGLKQLVGSLKHQIELINTSSTELTSASDHVSDITDKTNQGILRQQTETDLVATAINEMTATVVEVARNAADAARAATDADAESQNGIQVVEKTIGAIGELASEVEAAATVIQKLEDDTVKIGAILDVIRGIAEQTNLLALNAAIEAARAGEQGRGFAVVADEVRTLASRTQESTQEIQNMIETLQKGAHDAVDAMNSNQSKANETVSHANETSESLKQISTSIHTISDMNAQIATASEEQTAVTEEINRNVINISQIADDTAEGARQTMESSQQLTGLAQKLLADVNQFKIQ